ncbi:mitochondrial substrate carrier family protein, partial [Planoprotostelium fungivorum]
SIIKHEGVSALYKGFPIVGVCTVPAHALYFGGYEWAKKNLQSTVGDEKKSSWVHLISGAWADICGSLVWVPMDVVKQRLQIQQNKEAKYRGSWHALKTIIREEGPLGLYRGFLPAIATFGPFVAIYFTVYEQLKRAAKDITNSKDVRDIPFWSQLISGAAAGAFSAAITCPMDVIKTRVQVSKKDGHNGAWKILQRTMREEGVRAFTRGMGARILWIAPGTAVTIALYEQFRRALTDLQ